MKKHRTQEPRVDIVEEPPLGPEMNSLEHGGCSDVRFMRNEKRDEYVRLREAYLAEYSDIALIVDELLEKALDAHWLTLRNDRNVKETELRLYKAKQQSWDWDEDEHHKLQLFLRYQTGADRRFARALGMLEAFRGKRMMEERLEKRVKMAAEKIQADREADFKKEIEAREKGEKLRAEKELAKAEKGAAGEKGLSPAQKMFQGQLHPKKRGSAPAMSQWVQVRVEDGRTVTKVYPPNEEMITRGQRMWPAPVLVYRRFDFVNGVPPEYHWCTSDEKRRANGGAGIQRMTADAFLEVMAREKAEGSEHVGPTGCGNLPRPKQRSGCDCEVCTKNKWLLEIWEKGGQVTPSAMGAGLEKGPGE